MIIVTAALGNPHKPPAWSPPSSTVTGPRRAVQNADECTSFLCSKPSHGLHPTQTKIEHSIESTATCSNLDECHRRSAEWKADTKASLWLHSWNILEQAKLTSHERTWHRGYLWLPRLGKRIEEGAFWSDGRVLNLDLGGGSTGAHIWENSLCCEYIHCTYATWQ